MAEVKLQLRHVRKSFQAQPVLRDINLTLLTGEVVALLGPSGSGKTTLLRCINFLEQADSGTMRLGTSEVTFPVLSKQRQMEIRRDIGFVFQNFPLFKHMTAEQNIMEGLVTARRWPVDEARKKAHAAMDQMGLADKYGSYYTQLSGGEQQRVAMGRALVLDPELLLFDEPTSALDPKLVGEVLQRMREIAQLGIAMIVVTHEISFAYDVADRVVFMENGVIVEDDPKK
jgi:L-cystine transport system ATP-binding protein